MSASRSPADRRAELVTLADEVVVIASPLLLIGLMTCLTFFLLEVAYRGEYPDRLRYIFFFFIVAAVLISRIAMTLGRARAIAYAAALAVSCFLVIGRFVEFQNAGPLGALGPFLPYLAIGLIWWCIDVLTHDCTHTGADETGLLDLGLLKKSPQSSVLSPESAPASAQDSGLTTQDSGKDWWEKYQDERKEEQRRHRPGTWLVVFSLAALPLFALGQAAIPAADEPRRRFVYWLLTGYVGCGLGLLLTTSFLGLRRYLRQRNLEMPRKLTVSWLGIGVAMILFLLVVATFLPRPAAEYSIPGLLGMAGSKKRDADRFAFFNFEKGGDKKGQAGGKGEQPGDQQQHGNGPGQKDQSAQAKTDGNQGQGGKGKSGQPESGGKSQNSDKQGQGQGGSNSGKNQGNPEQNSKGQENKGEKKEGSGKDPNDPNRRQPQGSEPNKDQSGQAAPKSGDQNEQNLRSASAQNTERQQDQSSAQPPQFEPDPPSALGNFIKWLFIIAALIALAYALIRYRAELWAWLQSLLAGWGWPEKKRQEAAAAAVAEEEEEWRPPPPFSSFRDPFEQPGRFKSNEEIVRYSYAALESWAYEQNLGRRPEETPLEFIRKLTDARPKLDETGKKLVDSYSIIIYAKGRATKNQMEAVRTFWRVLPDAAVRARVAEEVVV